MLERLRSWGLGGYARHVTFSDQTKYVERTAKLLEAGDYPDKGIEVTTDDLDAAVASFKAPLDMHSEHKESPLSGLTSVTAVFRRAGDLFGKVRMPEAVWNHVKTSGNLGLSACMDRKTKFLKEVSWTNKPRVASAAVFSVTDDTLSFNGAVFAEEMRDKGLPAEDSDEVEDGTPASGRSVSDLLKLLTEVLDFTLPSDTTGENFVERAVTALTALRGADEEKTPVDGTVKEPPQNSKQQPGPVAMSKELDFAVSLLSEASLKNPKTGKPYTKDEIVSLSKENDSPTVTVKMSEEDQASVNWARREMLKSYKSRIEACVKSGRVPAAQANELWESMTKAADTGDLTFAFDDKGEPKKTHYDLILSAWEHMPPHLALTGHSPTSAAQRTKLLDGSSAFSLASGVLEHGAPDFSDPDENVPLTEEEADVILSEQWANSGKRPSQVEGGFEKPKTNRMAGAAS